jgi:hypothetical protein
MKNKYKIKKKKINKKTNKRTNKRTNKKTNKKTNKRTNNKQKSIARITRKRKTSGGGGLFNSVAKFAFHAEKDTTTPLSSITSPMNKLFSNKSMFDKTNPNIFRAHFNYGTPYQVELLGKMQAPILNSRVQNEPHLFIPNMYRYLFLIIELAPSPFSKLLWLASFKNRSKEHTYQTYLPPMITAQGVRNYRLQAYKFPKETPPYVTFDTPLSKRAEELVKLFKYIKDNTQFLGAQPVFIRNYKVKYDAGNALFTFISPVKKDKLAGRER